MFRFCSALALALAAPLASGLQLDTPTNWITSSRQNISWTNQQGDPATWSFELVNPVFHNAFAVANNVDPSSSPLAITLGVVPPDSNYVLQAVNIGNISDIYASSGTFTIGANPNATAQTTTGTGTATGTGTNTSPSATTGTTTTGTATATAASTTTNSSGSSATSASSTSKPFNSGAIHLTTSGSFVVTLLCVVAAAAISAF